MQTRHIDKCNGVTVKPGLWTGLDWTGLDWICACALKYCYSCSVQLPLNMDVVAVSSDSERESEVIRPTSAVVFTPTSLNMDVVVWTLWQSLAILNVNLK